MKCSKCDDIRTSMSSSIFSSSSLFSGATLFEVNVDVMVENLMTLIRLFTFVWNLFSLFSKKHEICYNTSICKNKGRQKTCRFKLGTCVLKFANSLIYSWHGIPNRQYLGFFWVSLWVSSLTEEACTKCKLLMTMRAFKIQNKINDSST